MLFSTSLGHGYLLLLKARKRLHILTHGCCYHAELVKLNLSLVRLQHEKARDVVEKGRRRELLLLKRRSKLRVDKNMLK
jgi:hypothetical protein